MRRRWPQFGIIRALYPSALVGWNGFAVQAVRLKIPREAPGVFQLNEEGIHHAWFYV